MGDAQLKAHLIHQYVEGFVIFGRINFRQILIIHRFPIHPIKIRIEVSLINRLPNDIKDFLVFGQLFR